MTSIKQILAADAERFLDEYADYGFGSREDMLLEALHLLRTQLRQEVAVDYPVDEPPTEPIKK